MLAVFCRPELGDYVPPRPRLSLWVAAYIGGSLGGAFCSSLLTVCLMVLREGLDPRAFVAIVFVWVFAVPVCMLGTGIVTALAFFMWSILANKRGWVWALLGAGIAMCFLFNEGPIRYDFRFFFGLALFMTCGAMTSFIFWKLLTQDDQ